TTGDGSSLGRTEFAVNKTGGVVTIYAAAGTANGTLFKSIDGGATFVTAISNGFCNPQCFYDIAVAVDPNDPEKVYLGGSPALVFGRSTNGGRTFTNSSAGLHVDTHAFAIAPSDTNTIYFGSDGGIWKSTNAGINWTTLNNTTFSATQFMGLALHPLDRNYLLGGTQDNGTQFLAPNGTTWVRSDGGDGGFAVIDKTSPSITSITAYHTYFNATGSQIGFSRATTTDARGDPNWTGLLGCGGTANGISCADPVLFYAPMVGGPGNPNSLYFGTNRLYRSADRGTTMTDVSGTLPARVSAIGIAPQDDNVRLAGTTAGRIYLSTTAGATTMNDVTGAIPARYVGRIAIDPTNANIAYVALNGFGIANQHVWKTTNLLSGTPTWTVAGNGIPDVPVNAFAVDPQNTQRLYAGTDIGVFRSVDGGANWTPFSDNLPRVAVFGLEIQPVHRVLRIATHGRGIWEYNLNAVSNRTFADFDGDGKSDVSVFRPENGTWYILGSQNGFSGAAFGDSNDKIVPADYDGDGKTDLAVYRNGIWYLQRSTAGFAAVTFGAPADIPQPADLNGDGKAEIIVFRPSNGTWYAYNLADNSFTAASFGQSGDKPVVGDYDGDGKADYAVFRNGIWYVQRTTLGFLGVNFGASDDRLVPADYDGDGKTDIAVFRASNGTWYLLQSTAGFRGTAFGISTDLPVPADYDGDGKADIAVFRGGTWYLNRSTAGFFGVAFGANTDKPVQNAFIP
ncbi:MAG: VCBS repeat-containing protein, partial [Pyrinomonadaceae bacterium]|nr:VCBS repeat-containing protein [Pyrinomonadaceae bacterium]